MFKKINLKLYPSNNNQLLAANPNIFIAHGKEDALLIE